MQAGAIRVVTKSDFLSITNKAGADEVKQFLRAAFYRRFGLSPEPEFVEIHPGGGAVGARLNRFDSLSRLVQKLRQKTEVLLPVEARLAALQSGIRSRWLKPDALQTSRDDSAMRRKSYSFATVNQKENSIMNLFTKTAMRLVIGLSCAGCAAANKGTAWKPFNSIKSAELARNPCRPEDHFALKRHAGCVMEVRFKDIDIQKGRQAVAPGDTPT